MYSRPVSVYPQQAQKCCLHLGSPSPVTGASKVTVIMSKRTERLLCFDFFPAQTLNLVPPTIPRYYSFAFHLQGGYSLMPEDPFAGLPSQEQRAGERDEAGTWLFFSLA